jgi:ASC-1-like (ASCH) protein
MDDLDITSVSLPLVANESSYLNFLKEYATNEVPEGSPVFEVFNTEKYKDDIAKFQELNKLKDSLSRHSAQFEDVLRGLMTTMANSVQSISALKIASTDKIVFESNKVLYKILKSPYNHYSPVLEASEIERIKNENFNYAEAVNDYVPFQLKDSSKVRYNLLSDTWTAEDGSTTNFPFGVHQIHEEIVAPIVQNLMNETRIERLKIYNHIKDQKISYLNKWHQDTEDFYGRNRAESADLINLMRASLRDYVAAYNTLTSLKKTEDSMAQSGGSLDSTVVTATENSAEVFAAFEIQSKEFQNVQMDFENYMERLKEDIDVKAGKFEHIDYYDALLRDGNSKNIAVASSEVHELEERRKPLITVNPLFAKTSEMLPVPHIEDITYDHISLNLPSIAKNTLRELDEDIVSEPTNNVEVVVSNDDVANSSDIEEEAADNLSNPISDEEIIVPNDEESLSDDLTNEENLESDEENSDEAQESELEIYTEEELGEFSDSDLAAIMDEFDIEPMEDFDRNEAISIILEAQINANKDEDEEDNTNNN